MYGKRIYSAPIYVNNILNKNGMILFKVVILEFQEKIINGQSIRYL